MGAEIGATTSVFPYNERMAEYLRATNREGKRLILESLDPDDIGIVSQPLRIWPINIERNC